MDAPQCRFHRKFRKFLHEKPIAADFKCPLGGLPMTDPVVAEDGYSYERSAITAWLQDQAISPRTRMPMSSRLEDNGDLKKAIGELKMLLENPPAKEVTITWNAPGPERIPRSLVISPSDASDSSDWEVLSERQTDDAKLRAEQTDMSYILSKIFRVLDPLRQLLLDVLDGWTPQSMVVIGDESAGKSTVLEMLAMLSIFPRKRRFCTRLATHLRLRRNPDLCRTTLSVCTVTSQGERREGKAMVVPKENGDRWVQEQMDRLVLELSDGQEGSGGIVTEKIIVVEVQHPEVPSIDLVDLPGITSVPKEKAEAVQQIMQKQIRDDKKSGNNHMFLAVVPASGDVKPNTNNAMKFIMENQLEDRTVGVFSKCDQTSKNGSDVLRALVLNEPTKEGESPESLGRIHLQTWVASMLEPPKEYKSNFERLELQGKNEIKFFQEEDENFRELYQRGHAGMRALIANIERSYLNHLNTTWKPNAMRKVLLKEKDVAFQLCMLGLVEDATARSSLAKEEVERRLGVTSPVTKHVYENFLLRALRVDLAIAVRQRLSRYDGSGFICDGCEQMEEMASLQKELLSLIQGAVDEMQSGLVAPLQSWLSAKSEVVQIEDTDLVNVRTASSDGFSLMRFEKDLSKKELVQQLHAEPLLQLCNYSSYVDEIMAKCQQMHADAGLRIRAKAAQLVAKFVDLDGGDHRMEVHPLLLHSDHEVSKVELRCNVDEFLRDLLGLFLREIPSPKKLQRLHEGVEVGKERSEAEQELGRLKEEMRKTEVARDGIRRALDIDDEEFEQMRQKLEAEADSADCCLSREGTTALSWPTSTSSASSGSRSLPGEEATSSPTLQPAAHVVSDASTALPSPIAPALVTSAPEEAATSTNLEAALKVVPDAATTHAIPASEANVTAQLPDVKTGPPPPSSQQTDQAEAGTSAEIGGQVYLLGPAECPDRRWMLLADAEEAIPDADATAASPSQPVSPVVGKLVPEAPLTASEPADVPAPKVKHGDSSSSKAGDRVKFARDSDHVADWSGMPGTPLAFSEGQVETIHEVRGDWFCTTKWQTLWAPLSAVEYVEDFPPGQEVVVVGHQKFPEHNGKHGKVLDQAATEGHYRVEIDGGSRTINVKKENMQKAGISVDSM
ncbi:mx1 [Symbiodinium sp. CCMP2456]|nr:mx1 [Symbiodinium sp. CCMP2456]